MKFLLRFLKPLWKLCLLAVFCIFFDIAGALYIPTLAADMLNAGTSSADLTALVHIGIKMAVASLISGAGAILGSYVCAILSGRLGKDIRDALYQKTLKLSVTDFKHFGTASVTTRTIADITNIQMSVISFIQMALPVPIIFALSAVLTFQLDAMAGWLLLVAVVIVLVTTLGIMRGASPLFRRLQKILDRMGTVLLENITGVRVIRAFRKEKDEEARMQKTFSDYADTSIKASLMFAHLDGISFLMINIFVCAVYWISGARISLGHYQIGDINAIINYAILLMAYLMMAQMIIMILPRALECCARVQEILDYSPEITDLTSADAPVQAENDEVLSFHHVYFRYADAEANTLHDLDFVCRKGQTTAIIGGTGRGKSTVASLILRFHDVTSGSVCLNGTDIRDITQAGLRSRLSYVQQKAWLFSGTIAENLRYSNPDATDEELWHALEVAQARDFVEKLPEGLNARVAQGGTNFSGGQKQRLSIARVFLYNPPILILDEATSSVDTRTEKEIGKAMSSLMENRTSFVIAHRLSTIRDADTILFMQNGNIIEQGNHEELLRKKGAYAALYYSQF
ncbi:MAG TPA: ABC transporter ATP-binding protein/permease [Candidatus Bariatricus faecipullorum]|nr:ABC transporter ATP-binding protein/permease [Candidatus Bariatricus faecipullorum]